MAMELGWSRDSGVLIGTVSGRIDSANSMDCHEALGSGIGPDDRFLLLNMAGITFLSSAGLRVLLMLAKKFTGPDKTFALCALKDHINEVISVSGFSQIIQVFGSQGEALGAIAGTGGGAEDAAGDDAEVKQPAAPPELRNPLDMGIVGENISDVAQYTVEKYEFINAPLAEEVRAEAVNAISTLLWQHVKRAIDRRRKFRAELFESAEAALENVVAQRAT